MVASIISAIASTITIALIYKMSITALILTMPWYQLIYDLSYFNHDVDVGNYPVKYLAFMGQMIAGIGSSIISNWIAFAVFFILKIFQYYQVLL